MSSPPTAATSAGARSVSSHRLEGFEGLRAVAALSVFAYHLLPRTGLVWKHRTISQLAADLNAGVVVFFVISGFLLYLPFSRALAGTRSRVALRGYLVRRAARIYPAYWLTLGVTVLWILPDRRFSGLGEAARHVLLVHSYAASASDTFRGLLHAWSLVVEVSFYLFLPLFAAAVSTLATRVGAAASEWTGTVAVAVAGLVAQALVQWGDPPRWVQVLPAYLFYFAIGIGLAVARVRLEQGEAGAVRFQRLASRVGRWWSLAAVVYVGAALVPVREGPFSELPAANRFAVFAAHGIVAFALVLPFTVVDARAHPIRRLVKSRPMELLGTVSYGIYLWHLPLVVRVADDLGHGTNPYPLQLDSPVPYALLGGTVLVAWLSYRYLEAPLVRWSHRVAALPARTIDARR